jgi:hypothetical protein
MSLRGIHLELRPRKFGGCYQDLLQEPRADREISWRDSAWKRIFGIREYMEAGVGGNHSRRNKECGEETRELDA